MNVLVAPADKRKAKVYHTKDCGRLPANPQEMREKMAISHGYRECGHCEGAAKTTPNRSHYQSLVEAANE